MLKFIKFMKIVSYIGLYGNSFTAIVDVYMHNMSHAILSVVFVLMSLYLVGYWHNREVEVLANTLSGGQE